MTRPPPPWLENALNFSALKREVPALTPWLESEQAEVAQRLLAHGDFSAWLEAVATLPHGLRPLNLDEESPRVGQLGRETAGVHLALRALGPWRKGPFSIAGVELDAEWRCFLKWRRVTELARPFAGRRVLDVGCGNGYFLLRLLGAGAQLAVGIEPSALYTAQFLAIARTFCAERLTFLPVGIERFPKNARAFDSVLSMGVLYHRREPREHLSDLFGCLRPGGELVLETLIVDGPNGHCLVPDGRYAQMRNVWCIPSLATLEDWLNATGFRNLRCGNVTVTTAEEQRTTSWMPHPSLQEFLAPGNSGLTVEGHPAPARVVLVADAP